MKPNGKFLNSFLTSFTLSLSYFYSQLRMQGHPNYVSVPVLLQKSLPFLSPDSCVRFSLGRQTSVILKNFPPAGFPKMWTT